MSETEITTAIDRFRKIDFNLLKEQKLVLVNMIQDWGSADDPDQVKDAEKVEGLLDMISDMQDVMVDVFGMDEDEVFQFERE